MQLLLQKRLLSAENLNSAFLSLTTSNSQSINGDLRLGGALTLQQGGSQISDRFNPSYMQIDPQGSHIAVFDGANNQKLSIYSSDGSKGTYVTTLSSENYGLIDVTGVDRLEINTNSGKSIRFGGDVLLNKSLSIGTGTPIKAGPQVKKVFLSIRGSGSTINGETVGVLELADSASDTNGRMIGLIQASDHITQWEKRVAGIAFWSDGTANNDRGGAITFLTKPNGVGPATWNERMRIDNSGDVGIGVAPSTIAGVKLEVAGAVKATSFIAKDGAGARSFQGTDANNSISIYSHSGATWLRNVAGIYSFQAGNGADDWTPSFQFYQPPATTNNAAYFEMGQRFSNTSEGRYRGIRIVKYGGSDGDIRAGNVYATNALVLPVGFNKYAVQPA